MGTNRFFKFNSGSEIQNTLQVGNLSISDYPVTGYKWWPGPDEDLGYIITHEDTNPNHRTEGARSATVSTNSIGFWRVPVKTNQSFLNSVNSLFKGRIVENFTDGFVAKDWLLTNGYWTSYPDGALRTSSRDGSLRTSSNTSLGFGYGGVENNYPGIIYDIEPQADGKILVGGNFNWIQSGTVSVSPLEDGRSGLVRLNPDGTEDVSFWNNLISTGDNTGFGGNRKIFKIKYQPDGKILIGGSFDDFNGFTRVGLIRLNANGTEDTSFYSNLISAASLTLPPSVGTGFGSGYTSASAITAIDIQSDGKILIGGRFTRLNADSRNGILRLNSDGTEDTAFYENVSTWIPYNSGAEFDDVVVQSDGKILLCGSAVSSSLISRLNSDGTLDSTFMTNLGTRYSTGRVWSLFLQPDGKILVGWTTFVGGVGNYSGSLIRLNSDGTEDSSFNANLISTGDGLGFKTNYQFPTVTEEAVSYFAQQGNPPPQISSIQVQPDGKIIVGGAFTSFNGFSRPGQIIRLNPDGTEDTTFNPPALAFAYSTSYTNYPIVYDIHLSSTGIVYVGGAFNTPVKSFYMSNAYTSTGGSLYTNSTSIGFGYAGIEYNASGGIYDIEPQADGKILIGGNFGYIQSGTISGRSGLVRLNSDGTEDTSFWNNLLSTGNNNGFQYGNGSVRIIKIKYQPDGKILVGGGFTTLNGFTRNSIVRLNADGTEDTTFYTNLTNSGSGSGFDNLTQNQAVGIKAIEIQSDGKILVGGGFRRLNGTWGGGTDESIRNGIVRLNSDGSEDTAFYTNASSWIESDSIRQTYIDDIFCIKVQPDGKILMSGLITNNYAGSEYDNFQGIYRLNSDGTLDTTFDSNLGKKFWGTVGKFDLQPDGKIVLALANYSLFNGNPRKGLVRLNSDGTEDVTFYNNFTSTGNGLGITHSSTQTSASYPTSFAFQPDGKILLGGVFDSLNGFSRPGQIIRLNSDGTEDITFSPPPLTNTVTYTSGIVNQLPYINDIYLSPNGILYVGGTFTTPGKAFYMSYSSR